MDSSQLNKYLGALLGTVFVVFSISLVSDALFAAHPPEKPGYVIEVAEEGEGGPAVEEETVSIAELLQDADPANGEAAFRKCQACHTAEQGGANKVGPNLWDVVDRPIASHEGFSYSSSMREFAADGEKVWDYEHLNEFLLAPKSYISGTAMAFAGLKKDDERADVIAYLRNLSDSPAPLPEPPMEEAESAEAPANGDAAAEQPESAGAPADGDAATEEQSE